MSEGVKRPKRHIDIIPIGQTPIQYIIFTEDGKELAGYCFITATIKQSAISSHQIKEAAIWHIYTDERFRNLGYAKNLIAALKVHYDTIYTQALTPKSKDLLTSCGFVVDNEATKLYRWTKDARA